MHLAPMGQKSRKCRRERWSSKTSSTKDSTSEFAGSSLQVAGRLLDDADCSSRDVPYILTGLYWIATISELIAMDMEVKCQSTSLEDVCTQEIPSFGKCLRSNQHEYTEGSVAMIQVAHRRTLACSQPMKSKT